MGKIIKFTEYLEIGMMLNEQDGGSAGSGDGGGGIGFAGLNGGGMGDVSSPGVSSVPGWVGGSISGSGDRAAYSYPKKFEPLRYKKKHKKKHKKGKR